MRVKNNLIKTVNNHRVNFLTYGTVWYHLESIAKILSYNSSVKPGFIVHIADGTNRVFTPSKKGLLFSDVKIDTAHVLFKTIDSIKSKYTYKQYTDSHKAQLIQNTIGQPSTNELCTVKSDSQLTHYKS